jgi:hypothetical protein
MNPRKFIRSESGLTMEAEVDDMGAIKGYYLVGNSCCSGGPFTETEALTKFKAFVSSQSQSLSM